MKEEEERTPLRTILQNFLNHIEKLDRGKLEGSYDKEFQELKLFSEFLKTSKQYSCSHGEEEVNRKKNRYKDILPFDCSRVILDDYAGIPGSDYINANYIKGASGSPAYIASQGPLPHTVNDFWRMVVQCEVQVIVMACNEEESGKHKCENYWVEHEGEEKQFGMVAIQLIKASVVCPDFLVRTMRLKYTKNRSSMQEERTVCQFHYSAWPDHGVPPLVRPLLDMVRLVRDTQASETLPVLVHCSAGCGRTGTICAIDYVWGLLRAGKLTKDFSLFKLVREMRKQRIAMVQTKEQYVLVHHAVKELFNEQLRMIDSHPYENIDVNGMVKESPEPVYATINCDTNNEEKQDSNEKGYCSRESEDVPPLPCKRRPYTAHTKQEKEVENLTEKQRGNVSEPLPASNCPSPSAGTCSSNSSTCGSLLHKPRIAKLRALFERSSNREGKGVQVKQRTPQQVTRSHSLGAVRKLDEGVTSFQPIPNRGVLRVPQLTESSDATYVRSGKPALPIKRSKSLKVLSSGEWSKFSVPILQGGLSQNFLCKEEGSCGAMNSTPKPSTSTGNPFIENKVTLHISTKKVTKEKFCDTGKHFSGRNGSKSSRSVDHNAKRMSENSLSANSHFSAGNSLRRSLDSLTLESDGAVLQMLPASTLVATAVKRNDQFKLDKEAKKLLQDCRDYLTASAKSEASKVSSSPERNCHDFSRNLDPMQNLTVEAQRKVNAVVGGLGTRERRNSFRQAISNELESGAKTRILKKGQFIKTTRNTVHPGSNECVIQNQKVNSKPFSETSCIHMQVTPKANAYTSSNQSSEQLLELPARSISAFPKVPGSVKMEATSSSEYLNSNHQEHVITDTKWVKSSDVPPKYANVCDKKESMYVKETKCDTRAMSESTLLYHSKSHRPPYISGQTRLKGDRCGSNHVRVPANSLLVNHDVCGYKEMDAPVSRTMNAVPNTRLARASVINVKQCNSQNVNETKISVLGRVSYKEVSQLPQNSSVTHDAAYLPSTVNEQLNINSEGINSVRKFKTGANKSISSKQNNLKEINPIIPQKHEMLLGPRGRSKDQPESSIINQMRRQKWVDLSAPGPSQPCASGEKDRLSGSGSRLQELRFLFRENPEAVFDQGTNNGRSELSLGDPSHGERIPVPNRMASKLSVKENGPTAVLGCTSLHHDSQDDLALCNSGSGSSKVRRHASVVMLRHSLVDKDCAPISPLAVWNPSENGETLEDASNGQNVARQDFEAWSVAPGVDVDLVGASIKPNRDHGSALTRALEAFHLRKPRGAAVLSPALQRRSPQSQQQVVKKQHYL